jgi:hypothetical protein
MKRQQLSKVEIHALVANGARNGLAVLFDEIHTQHGRRKCAKRRCSATVRELR